MKAMSSLLRWYRGARLLLVLVFAIALTATGFALAGAVSLQGLANPNLSPSGVPELLGPITQSGRKGWECMPERAAAATRVSNAELPAGSQP